MSKSQFSNDFESFIEDDFEFAKTFQKYLYYWKYFLFSSVIFFIVAFTYIRYSAKHYKSFAKIEIIDKREGTLELPTAADFFSKSEINLENEIEVIKSYPILNQVVSNLNLNTEVYAIGNIKKSLISEYPFKIQLKKPVDSILSDKEGVEYELRVTRESLIVVDLSNEEKEYVFKNFKTQNTKNNLPFDIINFDKKAFQSKSNIYNGFYIHIKKSRAIIKIIKENFDVDQSGKSSDIINLEFSSTNNKNAAIVLNEIIRVFNQDGIKDRQLLHKRTIDFINDRYSYLTKELDSIEIEKQSYKIANNLVDLNANSAISLEQSLKSEETVFSIENQISIIKLLIKTLKKPEIELLPANLGVNNNNINSLIDNYNLSVLKRKKIILSAGKNNPSIQQTDNTIADSKENIIFSLNNQLAQLKNTKSNLGARASQFENEISLLPEKEKILRSIERNQTIKEALYLFLLQKREEAQVSLAVTEPSIKIIENALVSEGHYSPNSQLYYLIAIVVAFIITFLTLYLMFLFNDKIYSRKQLEELKLKAPILSEVPHIAEQSNSILESSKERSPLAESFRLLASNIKYTLTNDSKDANIIVSTSTIKGEGKTFTAMNLALTLATLNKKVLLIGADLHNPQIHVYLDKDKNVDGLSNFLYDSKQNWEKMLIRANNNLECDILIGGAIPPNPAQLLSNGNFEKLLNSAKSKYDFIVIDTPPSLLVADTFSITPFADLVLFVVRCNHTKKQILEFIKDIIEQNKISNPALILNGLGAKSRYGYEYAYNYSYRYGYKYNYNYGYGYGYGE